MRYKVGDEVVLRDDLEEGADYGGWSYNKKIGKPGSEVVITNIDTDRFCGSFYQVDGQPNSFVTDEMIDHKRVAELFAKNERVKETRRHKAFWSMSGKESKDHDKTAELQKDNLVRSEDVAVKQTLDALDDYTHALMKYGRREGDNLDAIKPKHYRKGEVDLIESWYLTMPFEGFRWAMKSHINKYIYRFEQKNSVEDLDKASYYIKRLKEKELEQNESR